MNKNSFLLIAGLFLMCSCGSYKNVPYFQDLNKNSPSQKQVENYSPLTIKTADVIGINVSSRTPEASAIFNLNVINGSVNSISAENPAVGYIVDQSGKIQLPLIGNLKVDGLTTSQLKDSLTRLLLTYYKDPVVSVRIINFKISIFGDVDKPNVYSLQNERTTITQALSLAGDLNITAVRNITLIREENGKRMFIPMDLTSKKIFESPYYYLKNNDEIYVQPDRTKYATVDRGYRVASLVLSGLSIIAIVLSNLYR